MTTDAKTIITDDGFIINPETGEILGNDNAPEVFKVQDQESLEWVMKKMQFAEFELKAAQDRKAAIVSNLDKDIKDRCNRVAWLNMRFSREIEDYVGKSIDGSPKRSVRTPYGTAGFRLSAGKVSIKEGREEDALTWCLNHAPDAVKVSKSVLISKLPEYPPDEIFETIEPEDKFYLKFT